MDRVIKAARSSGSLNLSNRSLREVPDEVYKSTSAVGDDEKWWEAVELQKLILAHNNIELLKDELRNLPLLTVLNVSHNKLSELPAVIGELTMLKSLDVSFNSILQLPEEIGSAISLVKFDCSNNQLRELPSSLGRCSDLSEFKVSNNIIISLPEDLANCSKLMKLDMEGNKLTILSEKLVGSWTKLTELNASKNLLGGIPENIGSLSCLIRLDLHQNKISSIPVSIMGCSSLAEIYMGNNALSTLPAEMSALSHLGTLDLQSNQLKEYPVEACKLRLSLLNLSNNSLSGLPPELGKMTTLRKLLLTGNPIRTLRSTLVSGSTPTLLKYLRSRLSENEDAEGTSTRKEDVIAMAARLSIASKELSMEGVGLSAVPSEVWESTELMKVDLSRNSIQELPVELSSCINLQTLILSRNKITDWPGAILQSLPNLLCLKLDNNPLRQIPPDGFQAAPMLQILDLSGNVASLPEHPAFSSLPHLQELYLRRMQLREVPSEVLSLQQLRILDLSQNSLQSIPVEFKNLTSLTELGLSDNNISTLPPELGLLEPSLQALRLDGNPLRRNCTRIVSEYPKGAHVTLNFAYFWRKFYFRGGRLKNNQTKWVRFEVDFGGGGRGLKMGERRGEEKKQRPFLKLIKTIEREVFTRKYRGRRTIWCDIQKYNRRDDEVRMGRASHSRRVVQAMAHICRPSRSGNLDRSRQRRGIKLLDDYFVPNSAFPDTYFRRRFKMERHLFNKIMIAVCNHDSYFVQKKDAFGAIGLLPEQKIIVALRMLAYRAFADQVDEITRMGKSTILESLMRFCGAIEFIYTAEYLRKPANMDLERLLKKAEMRGFPGMIGSIDCMHWTWKKCPSAWQGAYGDRKGAKSIILETVAYFDTWIWHAFFRVPGAQNDINVLAQSPLFNDVLQGKAPKVTYEVNGRPTPNAQSSAQNVKGGRREQCPHGGREGKETWMGEGKTVKKTQREKWAVEQKEQKEKQSEERKEREARRGDRDVLS
ncbi:plant intracellular Ras-group-related LRR protein 6 [Pyrus ussuriensis x Pyrus communis]|uniref:Plant intracellular Ras-group-related LRR protein 6 n=1 Tax=Pyrus ussuriensis x Pyrus communis TaxID=2448454 RepID=A0A5N5FVT9_9ROSA|nr:plant intracellular Ras-group-related LRR protein 6 [Pyrus ussuriensis x Pyrus communis]